MTTLTETEASDLFRAEPAAHIEVTNDGRTAIAHRQVGSGPDVLFVHGWPVNSATFRYLLPVLAEHVTCHLIDLPGAGSSRYDTTSPLSIDLHVHSVQRAIEALGLDDVAVVGHDSGGLIARHAVAGDDRVRAMGLINTEPPDVGWRFRSFVAGAKLPGFGAALGWAAQRPRVRRNKFVLGDAFVDRKLLDGEFDEFFLRPLAEPARLDAGMKLVRSLDQQMIRDLPDIHARIAGRVQLVWGVHDPFFPVASARKMVATFPNASLTEIDGAGLFSHEEKPAEVAAALLPALTGA